LRRRAFEVNPEFPGDKQSLVAPGRQEDEEKILKACLALKLDYVANATIILLETGMRPMELFEMKKDQPLTGRARAEFEKHLALSKDDNVFPYKSIKKSWASVCRTARVQGLWFRWLRDEAENRWREAGMHLLDIAYLMGHASPRTTMIYNNPRREEIVRQMSAANPSKNK
jgi:integrase